MGCLAFEFSSRGPECFDVNHTVDFWEVEGATETLKKGQAPVI